MYIDIYALASSRDAALALSFLSNFMPMWSLSIDPDDFSEAFALPKRLNVHEQFQWLTTHPNTSYSHYFANLKGHAPHHLILSWNADTSLSCGLSVTELDKQGQDWRDVLGSYTESAVCFGTEYPPPSSKDEFERWHSKK